MHDFFVQFARNASRAVGAPRAFVIAVGIIVVWAILGPMFGFSDTWLQAIDSITAIITFFIVFLIQNTQNRDAEAINLKLNELIHAQKGARNKLIDLEELSDEEMEKLQKEFRKMTKKKPKVT